MQQLQIVPKYINQPKDPSWTNGSVKDVQGTLWSVDKNALGMFTLGQPVNIGYEPASGNKRYPQIVMASGIAIGQQPTAGTFQQAGQAAPPIPQQPYQQQPLAPPPQPHAPAPQASPGGASKECGMFVMGLLGRCLQGTGTFPDNKTLRDMVFNAKQAWEIEMEGRPEPQPAQRPLTVAGHPGPAESGQGGPPAGHPASLDPQAPLDDEIRW